MDDGIPIAVEAKAGERWTEAEVTELRKAFMALDLDNNGEITFEELREGIEVLGLETELDAETLLRQADTKGDGVVSFQEFLAIIEESDWQVILAKLEVTERKQQELDGIMRASSSEKLERDVALSQSSVRSTAEPMPSLQRWHSGDLLYPDDKMQFQDAATAAEVLRALENMWTSVEALGGEPRRLAKQEILALGTSKQREAPEIWVRSVSVAFGTILRKLDLPITSSSSSASATSLADPATATGDEPIVEPTLAEVADSLAEAVPAAGTPATPGPEEGGPGAGAGATK